jgi:hypothetical protein
MHTTAIIKTSRIAGHENSAIAYPHLELVALLHRRKFA